VYHGSPHRAALKELARTYQNLVEIGSLLQRLLELM